VKVREGQAFINWLVSPEGQKTIADYKVGGEQLFFPNAAGSYPKPAARARSIP
jgi:tungstate transport system substrate-binding protein